MKKKALFLGGAYAQIPILQEAKNRGWYIITCDYAPDNPGNKLADEYYNVSTTDKEKVLELAKKLNPDYVIAYAYYPILIDKDRFGISRDELFNALVKNNIVPRKYFYPLITDFACYKNITNYNVPIAKKIAHNVLTLPLYTELKTEDVLYICDAIKREKK